MNKHIEISPEIKYVHINDENNKVVLGIEDRLIGIMAYKFVQKSYQMSKAIRDNAIKTIFSADELVIFGHSLGQADSDYFKLLFQDMFSDHPSHERKIVFITYNDNKEILKQIITYVGGNIIPHHSYKNLSFIYTTVEESQTAYSSLLKDMS